MSLTEKYIVRKILQTDPPSDQLSESKPLEEGTFFVLRKQDMLANQALWAYIGTIRTAIDILNLTSNNQSKIGELSELADMLSELAMIWEVETPDKKLPD